MEATSLKGKKICILGLGRSGFASAKRLALGGSKVLVSEGGTKDKFDPKVLSELLSLGIGLEFGGHTKKVHDNIDLIVLSPGVHLDIPVLEEARRKNIRIVSEIEISFWSIKKPLIAVTGTNGKTTTTILIGEMLKCAGKNAVVAGNIGIPLSSIDDSGTDVVVAEISSYQLEAIDTFRPFISVITNITEDHLERHKTMEEYAAVKARIFVNQTASDFLVYNADDPIVSGIAKKASAKLVPFSRKKTLTEGFFVEGSMIRGRLGKKSFEYVNINDIFIKGEHNLENALACTAAAMLFGAGEDAISRTLKTFKGVEHRIEFVRKVSGISFYNDSKGTNPDSTVVALKALEKDITLIAGGRDKMGDLSGLSEEVKKRVKAVVVIGEAAQRLRENFARAGMKNVFPSSSMEEAVIESFSLSSPGDKVLLSPACASFDMFKDYEERGRAFKDIVNSLKEAGKQ